MHDIVEAIADLAEEQATALLESAGLDNAHERITALENANENLLRRVAKLEALLRNKPWRTDLHDDSALLDKLHQQGTLGSEREPDGWIGQRLDAIEPEPHDYAAGTNSEAKGRRLLRRLRRNNT